MRVLAKTVLTALFLMCFSTANAIAVMTPGGKAVCGKSIRFSSSIFQKTGEKKKHGKKVYVYKLIEGCSCYEHGKVRFVERGHTCEHSKDCSGSVGAKFLCGVEAEKDHNIEIAPE